MINLDVRTVVALEVLTAVVCTLVITDLWFQNRKRFRGLGWLAANYAIQSLGLLGLVLAGHIPVWLSVIVANTFLIVGAVVGLWGLELFVNQGGHRRRHYLLVAAFVGVQIFLTYGYSSANARSINLAACLLIVNALTLSLVAWRCDEALRPLMRSLRMVYSAYCLIFVIRIILVFADPASTNKYFQTGLVEATFHIVLQMMFILLTFSISYVVNTRLLRSIQLQEEKYSKAFHASPYGILLTRLADGRIAEVNEGFAAITGHLCSAALGKSTYELNLWKHGKDRDTMVATLMAGKSIRSQEFEFKKKTGEGLTALFSADVITIDDAPFIFSIFVDISERKHTEAERERLVSEREKAFSELRILSGLLPICASCKKIRDDTGYWNQIEVYIKKHSEADFSHGVCPECMQSLYPDIANSQLLTNVVIDTTLVSTEINSAPGCLAAERVAAAWARRHQKAASPKQLE